LDHLPELDPIDELHRDEPDGCRLAVIMDATDVLVGHAARELDFREEALRQRRVVERLLSQDLDRDRFVQCSVARLVYHAHPAPADVLENLEFPYEGKAYLKVTGRKFVADKIESPYALELARVGGDAAPAASEKAAARDKAAATASETAPVQASSSRSGGQTIWIGFGVLAVGVLVADAYQLGKRK
jgi:hypothetical protein